MGKLKLYKTRVTMDFVVRALNPDDAKRVTEEAVYSPDLDEPAQISEPELVSSLYDLPAAWKGSDIPFGYRDPRGEQIRDILRV